ncbi:MAG: amidohydrolase family protein [Fimbriimonadaceae bacterium]
MSYVADYLGPEGFGSYHVDWNTSPPTFTRVSRPPQVLLVPGFVDIHIHGAYGIDFMSASREEMRVLCNRLAEDGYECFLPTTITFSVDRIRQALANLPEHEMIGGFHLEGPFISPKFPGAQPPSAILDPPIGPSEWDEIFDDPRLKVITMAPERPGALELISRLTGRGVIVSMGHTDATFDEARRGFEFGARHTTHTYNAMRGLHHREAGTVGYAIANDSVSTELIYDRIHVSREAAGLLVKVKPPERLIAVSDGTMAAGMPPGQVFEMWGHRVETLKGRVNLAGTDTLAGSAITLLNAFRNLAEDFGPEVAIRACSLNPRKALKMEGLPRVFLEMDKSYAIVGRRVLSPV